MTKIQTMMLQRLFDMTSALTPFKPRGTSSTKFYTRRLHPEVQPLTLCAIFDKKGTTFILKPFIDK